jgi:hypothetical protein
MLTEPTSTQRQAFDLIGVPVPLTLKQPERGQASPQETPGQTPDNAPSQP